MYGGDGMKKVYEIIKYLERTNSRSAKIAILRANRDYEMLKSILYYCYNPYLQFGVSSDKLPKGRRMNTLIPVTVDDVFRLLDKLATKQSATEKEKQLLADMICTLGKEAEYVFKRIIDKDLKCGVNVKTIKEVFGDDFIPEFSVMLAKLSAVVIKKDRKYEFASDEDRMEVERFLNECNGEFYINPKLDGVRCIAEIDVRNRKVKLWSRNGKLYELPFLEQRILDAINMEKVNDDEIMLDGEITVGIGDFQTMMQLARRKTLKPHQYRIIESVKYNVFDVVIPDVALKDRIKILKEVVKQNDHVKLVEYVEGIANMDFILEQFVKYKELGYEGIMLKDKNAKYERKRTNAWCKVKDVLTIDVEVIDVVEGTGKYKGMVGALVCKDENGTVFYVGSGLSDSQRKEWWLNKNKIIGKVIEVKVQEFTKDGKPRFPTFLRIRPDKS